MNKGQQAVADFENLKTIRLNIDHYWREAFRFTFPFRGQGFNSSTDNMFENANNAQNDNAQIYDSTAPISVRLLASSMIGGLTPASSQWFNLQIPHIPNNLIEKDSILWLEQSSKTLFKLIHSSNYNETAYEAFKDIGVGGMVGIYIEKEDGGPFMFETWALENMYCADMLGKGRIDTVFRSVPMTASEAVNRFGIKVMPTKIKDVYGNNRMDQTKFEFIHCIKPRILHGGKQSQGKTNMRMPWMSMYVEKDTGTVVKESGYHEMPVIVPRWSVIPGSVYATGPINECLPDVKSVNKLVEVVLTNADMSVAGTFIAKNDGILNPNTIRIGPRKIVFAADVDNIKPLVSGSRYDIASAEIQRIQKQIRSAMMADELSPIQKDYASATEVQVRAQIIRQILGPVYARLQSEYLQPLITRCFGLAFRDGSLGEAPESLLNYAFVPEYQSPLARAQKMEEVTAIDQFEQGLAASAQLYPSVLDNYDADAASRRRSELLGVPQDLMKSQGQVRASRQKQAEMAQQQQEAELASSAPDNQS